MFTRRSSKISYRIKRRLAILALFLAKLKECKSFTLALIFPLADLVIRTTLFSVFRFFGIPREKISIKHAEVYHWATTLLFVALTAASFRYPLAGWAMVVIGTVRILQILAINFLFIYFDFRLFSKSVHDRERARWHFVAFTFTIADLTIIYASFYYFFNHLYGIFDIKSKGFIDYLYLSAVTITTLGCNYINPVKALGKILIISEVGIGVFLFVLIINTAMVHYRHLYEKL